jgi:hypothetical protein
MPISTHIGITEIFYCILERLTTFSITLAHAIDRDSGWVWPPLMHFWFTQYIVQSCYSLTIQRGHVSGWHFSWIQLTNSRCLYLKQYTTLADYSNTHLLLSRNIYNKQCKISIWASYTFSIRWNSIQQYNCFILPYLYLCVTKDYSTVPKFHILYQCSVLNYLTKKSCLIFQQEQMAP